MVGAPPRRHSASCAGRGGKAVVTVRLPDNHIAALDVLAAANGTTRAEEIRRAVADRLAALRR